MIWSTPQGHSGAREDRPAAAVQQAHALSGGIASNEAIADNKTVRAISGRRFPVLLAAHNDRDAAQILLALRRGGFDVRHTRVSDLDGLKRELASSHWEMVISDLRMPLWSGLDVLQTVRASHPTLAVLLVCGAIGEDAAVDAIRQGACDCISRGQLQARLARSVQRELDRLDALEIDGAAPRHRDSSPRLSAATTRSIFESSPVACMMNPPLENITYVNDRFVALSGYTREELVGNSPEGLGLLVDDAQCRVMLEFLRRDGRLDGTEVNFRRKDGVLRRAMVSTSQIDIDGEAQYLHSFVDVTRQRDAFDQARLASQAFASVSQGIVISDAQRVTLSVNHAFEAMSGYSEAELKTNPWSLLQGPDTSVSCVSAIDDALEAGQPFQGEILNYRKDGSAFWNNLSISPVFAPAGELTHFVGIQQDITERKAQETMRKLTEQVFAQSREGVVVTDAKHRIMRVNRAFTSITGYDESEILGRHPRMLLTGTRSAQCYRDIWRDVRRNGSWQGDRWNHHRSGRDYLERLTISVLRDASGRISNYIGTFSDITEQHAAQEKIDWLAHFDPMTGLPNRDLLADRSAHDISLAKRDGTQVTMMALDMDRFKHINDTLGFSAGNKVIKKFAGRLARAVRTQDTVARLHSDEFVLVLPGESRQRASALADGLLAILSEPFGVDDTEALTGAAIGIAVYPTDGEDFETLFNAAQVAMHQAKEHGGNQYCFYSAKMFEATLIRLSLGSALRSAIQNNQLMLHYQPFVDMQTGRIAGMEALLRWNHPEHGAVSPATFIPLAEQSGQIVAIGTWALRQACSDLRAWRGIGLEVPPVSVNLSPLQFRDPELLHTVRLALLEYEVRPEQICLELTEGAVMDDVPHSEQVMHALKELGVRLSLDDFGTGYSSLSYLKRFPFDKVKIDQSFVRGLDHNSQDAVIAKVVISMSHGLGLKVIAEGVETEMQCDFMRHNLCDEIQGYFFSRPVPVEQMQAMLQDDRRLPAHLVRLQDKARSLLLVHETPDVVAALRHRLQPNGYRILSASNGIEGLKILTDDPIDIVVSQQHLPGMTGVQFLQQAGELQPRCIRIVVSDDTERRAVVEAIDAGTVYRCLTTPWDDAQLDSAIEQAFHHKALADENEQLNISVRAANQELTANHWPQREPRNPAPVAHGRGDPSRARVDVPARRQTAEEPDRGQTDFAANPHVDKSAHWQFADLRERLAATLDTLDSEIHDNAELQSDLIAVPAVECSTREIEQLFVRLLLVATRASGSPRGIVAVRNGTDGSHVWFEIIGGGSRNGTNPGAIETLTASQWVVTSNGPDLSVAHDIVRRHHGTMAVQSVSGHASSFRVTLPIVQPVFQDSALPLAP